MTNFLNSAMLSAGAASFGAIIEIEQNMSQAEIKTLEASQKMMDVQPLMLTALQQSYADKAHDTLVSGLWSGIGGVFAGAVQLGTIGYGLKSAHEQAQIAGQEPNEVRANLEEIQEPQAMVQGRNGPEVAQNQPEQNGPVAQNPAQPQGNQEAVENAAKAKAKRKKAAAAKYNEVSNRYTALQQIFGPGINSIATTGKANWDMDIVKKDGTAQAMGTIIQGNQTAQSSNANMVQTYEKSFENASQILAGIVSAQRN